MAGERPLIRAKFALPDGSVLTRDWSKEDVEAGKPFGAGPPDWLESPNRSWPHPQDPITFTGRVKPGHEQEARDLLAEDECKWFPYDPLLPDDSEGGER